MTKQEYLLQAAQLKKKIDKRLERIEEYKLMAGSPSSPNYNGTGGSKQHSADAPFVKWIIKITELEDEVAKLQRKYDSLVSDITEAIEALENEDYKTLLMLRYIQGLGWDILCGRMCISESTAFRWNRIAIKKLVVDDSKLTANDS